MQITPSTVTLEAGQSAQLRAVPSQSGTKWSSKHPAIATVNASGVVTAVAPGTARIVAKKGSQQAQATIVVPTQAPTPQPPDPTPEPTPPDPIPTPLPPATSRPRWLLDSFEEGIRIVQPNEPTKLKYLWNLLTDNGQPGVSVTDLASFAGAGAKSLHNRFDQSKAGQPPGNTYAGNWQFYFYPYTLDGALGMTDGWHYAREFVPGYPAFGRVNRLRFLIFVPPGTTPAVDHNFEFGTFHRELADSPLSAESNNWHFYAFGNLEHTGEWHQLEIDTKPQHQRGTGGTTEPGDRLHLSSVTPDATFFDLLTGCYFDFPEVRWPAPVDLYLDAVAFEEETRPENVLQVASVNGVYVRATQEVRLQWFHERGNATTKHEVRVSFEDIHTIGWDAALPAPAGRVSGVLPASAGGGVGFLDAPSGIVSPFDAYYGRMEYRTTNLGDLTGKGTLYLAIKPEGSATFRQFALALPT